MGSVGALSADLVGEVGDQLLPFGQIRTPVRVGGELARNAGQPRQRPGMVNRRESAFEDGRRVVSAFEFPHPNGCREEAFGILAVGVEEQKPGAERGPSRLVGEPGCEVFSYCVESGGELRAGMIGGGGLKRVDVAGGSIAEPNGRVVQVPGATGGRRRSAVASQDRFESVDRGLGMDQFGTDGSVGIAVTDRHQIEMVGLPAAGRHRVQLLSGLVARDESVHDVGGDALGGVDGGGVAEFDVVGDEVGR